MLTDPKASTIEALRPNNINNLKRHTIAHRVECECNDSRNKKIPPPPLSIEIPKLPKVYKAKVNKELKFVKVYKRGDIDKVWKQVNSIISSLVEDKSGVVTLKYVIDQQKKQPGDARTLLNEKERIEKELDSNRTAVQDYENQIADLKNQCEELKKQIEDQKQHNSDDSPSSELIRLRQEQNDFDVTIKGLRDENEELKKEGSIVQDVLANILTVMSELNNGVRDGKCNQEFFENNIDNLRKLCSPLGFDLYYYRKGDPFQIETDSSIAIPNQHHFEKTDDPELESRVYRCDSIGFRFERFGLKKAGKVTLYSYDLKKNDGIKTDSSVIEEER